MKLAITIFTQWTPHYGIKAADTGFQWDDVEVRFVLDQHA
jgi:hypothetical protein